MKKILFSLLAGCMLVGCAMFEKQEFGDVNNANSEVFNLTADEGSQQPVFGKMAKSAVYDFHANVPWVATVADSASGWLTIFPTSGDTGYHQVTLEVKENEQDQDRVGKVKFSGKGFEYVVEVKQTNDVSPIPQDTTPADVADEKFIPKNGSQLSFDSKLSEYGYAFYAAVPWKATVEESASNWLSLSIYSGNSGENNLTVYTKTNAESQDRIGTITFSGEGFEHIVYVTQAAEGTNVQPQDTTPNLD